MEAKALTITVDIFVFFIGPWLLNDGRSLHYVVFIHYYGVTFFLKEDRCRLFNSSTHFNFLKFLIEKYTRQ